MFNLKEKITSKKTYLCILKIVISLGLLFLFLASVTMMSSGFKMLGSQYIGLIYNSISNPLFGLLLGVFSTVLVQSSSVTTSITVGLVSAGVLNLSCAVGVVMGANIGTTITNTIVSIAYIKDKEKFKRVFPSAIIHDVFNICSVLILFPIELATGFLRKISTYTAGLLYGFDFNLSYKSPIKSYIKIPFKTIKDFLSYLDISNNISAIIIILISLFLIVFSLILVTRLMNNAITPFLKEHVNNINNNVFSLILFGIITTACVQSSSIVTSLIIPVVGSGAMNIYTAFPITLGANIGTTVTAILASMSGNISGLIIALVHLYFNIIGTCMVLLVKDKFIKFVQYISDSILKNRLMAVLYLISIFSLAGLLCLIVF